MKKTMAVLLAAGVVVAAGCEAQQKPAPVEQQVMRAERGVAEAVEQAEPQAESVMAQVEDVAAVAVPEAETMVDKAQELLGQAQLLLDQGKFEEAIAMAQKVLSLDPANINAQNIIAMAQEKLTALVSQQAGDVQSTAVDALGSLGK